MEAKHTATPCKRCDGDGERYNNALEKVAPCGACKVRDLVKALQLAANINPFGSVENSQAREAAVDALAKIGLMVHGGDTWRILSQGATRDGKTFCHLASTTRGRQQRNGWVPVQVNDWIDSAALAKASALHSAS